MKSCVKLAACAGVLALSATGAPVPAEAATTVPGATSWAAFSRPDPWVGPGDNLHWYVSSEPITQKMVGRPVKIQVNAAATIDCPALGLGVVTATGWRSLEVTPASCTANKVVVNVVADKAMVGHSLTLVGWSAVGANRTTAAVSGTVTAAGTTARTSVTADRADRATPVGPLALVGSYAGKTIYITSAPGVNEVWLGKGAKAVRLVPLDGQLEHASMNGQYVDVWTSLDGELHHWRYDVVANRASSSSLGEGTIVSQGKPGFWFNPGSNPSDPAGDDVLYDWGGVQRDRVTVGGFRARSRMVGFTDTHAVLTGYGMTASMVVFVPLDGGPTVTRGAGGLLSTTPAVDATGAVATWAGVPQGSVTCRVQPDWEDCRPV